MPLPEISSFVEGVLHSDLLDADQGDEVLRLQKTVRDARELARDLLQREWLTAYQINQIFQGKGGALNLGPYVLLERIGEGGMGQVFKARQKMLNRVVALKVIRKECLNNPKVILRFQREIRAAGQLSHPHIVRAYDADQVNGTYYIAMEYIDGVDLARLVKDEGPLRVDRALEYIRQAALGLQHALERGLVHRDIKPANLLVTRAVGSDRRHSSGVLCRPLHLDERKSSGVLPYMEPAHYPWGVVKVLDMGLARITDPFSGRPVTPLTKIGSAMGTPEFMAPEQARDSHASDVRADLYSLGCTLYFLLTGLPPFPNGTDTEKLRQHQFEEPASVGRVRRERLLAWHETEDRPSADEAMMHVPQRVEEVLRKLMAKQPADRHQTPIDLANDLQAVLQQLADGALLVTEAATGRTAAILVLPTAPGATNVPPDDATKIMPPMALLAPKLRQADRFAAKTVVLMAAVGGLAFLLVVTVIVVGWSRTKTSVAPGTPKVKDSDEPSWKRLLKNASAQRGSWEEARTDILRHRAAAATLAQAKAFDDLWLKVPTAFDELDRAKFEGVLPAGLPVDVIGVYGFAKGNGAKPVAALAISPTGRWLVTNEDDGVRLFDLLGSVIPHKIQAHKGHVHDVAVSPDGRLLASAGADGAVRIWDITTRTRLFSLDKHQRAATRIAFNHDGALLASAGKDGNIRLWDPRTGGEIRTIAAQAADIAPLAFAPDGKTIFWGGASKNLCWAGVKDSSKGPVGKYDLNFTGLRFLAFQPGGNLAILSNGQGSLSICTWDGTALVEKTTRKDHQQIHHVAFASDGKSFVSVGSEPAATLWDSSSLKPIKSWKNPRVVAHSAAFSPENRHIVFGAGNSEVYVIRLADHNMDALKKILE